MLEAKREQYQNTNTTMQIKGMDGQTYNVTGQGQGNLNTVLGAFGTLGALNNGNGILGGLFGGNSYGCSENTPVNRYELNMARENDSLKAENALLRADKYTDQKIIEAYKDLQGQIKELAGEVRANKDAQTAVNMQQAVYNGTNTATLQCMQNSIAALQAITKTYIPSSNVCQSDCCGCSSCN